VGVFLLYHRLLILGEFMPIQTLSNIDDSQTADYQEIKKTYQSLGIETGGKQNNSTVWNTDIRQGYWPPLPEYSVRFYTDEDLKQ
jgi:hypothetical protein